MSKDNKSPQATPEPPKGIFYENLQDGELYALEVVEPNSYNRTHRATNEAHTWEGTEKEFRDAFRRVD